MAQGRCWGKWTEHSLGKSAPNAEGRPRALQSSPACGTRVEQQANSSVVVEASYAGCYVNERDGSFVMTVQIEGPVASYKEELRCPNHLLVTAQCTPDGQFSVAISRDVTTPPLDLSSVHLVSAHGSRCAPVSRNEDFVVYRFPLSACGTTVQASGDQRVYENELVADRKVLTSHSGSITRDSTFRLTIRCSYSAEDFLPVNVIVSTLPPPLPAVGQGPLALEMRIATDEHYSTYYTDREYPVVKLLRDPVYVEVRILQRMDPSLVLVLHQCWATPSTNPLQQPEWPILVDGCPYEGDNYQTQLVPVGEASGLQFPSHHQRFIVSTFTFVDITSQRALSGPVYFHCSASACMPSGLERCVVQCPTNLQGRMRRASQSQAWGEEPLSLVTAEGPVDFQAGQEAEDDLAQEGSHGLRPLLEWGEVLVPLAGAVAALTVSVLVALGLRKHWGRLGSAKLPGPLAVFPSVWPESDWTRSPVLMGLDPPHPAGVTWKFSTGRACGRVCPGRQGPDPEQSL
ncbi:Zona pellucida sperm-binding protein 4 [Chelonia mydas]|uniref:Zona pellucida sperm-binding protein 4 n=1 Tax=Chelonia mydas TaxID=8469 RepID=M7B774_CHEMY|nr:Zona pellucida sperm-binding protein 4 [Chelonia mydas]